MNQSSSRKKVDEGQIKFEEVRARVFRNVGVASIHTMSNPELFDLQKLLGLGDNWGVLVFPREWFAPGTSSTEAFRTIDIQTTLRRASVRAEDLDLAIRTVVAATLLVLATPVFNQRHTQYLKPSTVCTNMNRFLKVVIEVTRLPARDDGKLLARLPMPIQGDGEKEKRRRIEVARFARFAERGFWTDVPSAALAPAPPPSPQGDAPVPPKGPKNNPYLPMNDKFVAEAGYRVAWVVETLGPALLECGQGIREIRKANMLSEGVRETQRWRRTELSKKFLADFDWKAPDGSPIVNLPFPMHFSGMGKGGKFSWPPRLMSQARMLLRVLQSAHLFVSLLSTGGRISEMLSLQPGSITESPNGIALTNGRTYKLSFLVDGEERDWPLPAIAIQALKQQEELAALAILGDDDSDGDEDGDADSVANADEAGDDVDIVAVESIWTREGGSGERIDGEYNKYLRNVVKIFGLSEEFGKGNLHAHRFRKTTARLIALAIVGAPKILMDLFGHKQIGMTLHYILADPDIRAEMLEVARAQTIMLAKTAITQADECGGPAAKELQSAVKAERFRMGSDFGEDSLQELAETLTINGRHWQLVRPGVLCTKGPQVAGACTPSTAMPEPSRCRSRCDHRLELAFLKEDVDKSIEFAVKELRQAVADDDDAKAEMWRGQILTNIGRFEELRLKWESHPDIGNFLKRPNKEAA